MSAPFRLPASIDLDFARTLHARRALEDALDHGSALLAALGLPPLPSMTRALDLLEAIDAPDEGLEDDGTAEPSLGAPEMYETVISFVGGRWHGVEPDQRHWADGGSHDREAEISDEPHDGEGDEEPSIGWPEDFTAKLDDVLQADHDPELDDADLESSEVDAPSVDPARMTGRSIREAAHV